MPARSRTLERLRRFVYLNAQKRSPRLLDLARRLRLGEFYRRMNARGTAQPLVLEPGERQRLAACYADELALLAALQAVPGGVASHAQLAPELRSAAA